MPTSFLKPLPADKILKHPNSPVVMTFGPQGFFGYSPCTTATPTANTPTPSSSSDPNSLPAYGPQGMWWSTWESVDLLDPAKQDMDVIRKKLIARHEGWMDPIIQRIVKEAPIDLLLPTWVTPKLPTWEKDGIVLVGDAAHGT